MVLQGLQIDFWQVLRIALSSFGMRRTLLCMQSCICAFVVLTGLAAAHRLPWPDQRLQQGRSKHDLY